MIHTRFGSQVQVLAYHESEGTADVRRLEDGRVFRRIHITELKADGGAKEILDEAARIAREVQALLAKYGSEGAAKAAIMQQIAAIRKARQEDLDNLADVMRFVGATEAEIVAAVADVAGGGQAGGR